MVAPNLARRWARSWASSAVKNERGVGTLWTLPGSYISVCWTSATCADSGNLIGVSRHVEIMIREGPDNLEAPTARR